MRAWLVLGAIACQDGQLAARSEPPTAEIVSHVEGELVAEGPVDVVGLVSDSFTRPEDLFVTWRNDGRAMCGSEPTSDGRAPCRFVFLPGPTEIALEVRDPDGLTAGHNLTLQVLPADDPGVPNEPPACAIVQPSDGDVLRVDEDLRLEATGTDDKPDRLQYFWSSDRNGAIDIDLVPSDGEIVSIARQLDSGSHLIELRVTDEQGETCRETVQVTLGFLPDLQWVGPQPGDVVASPATLELRATDPDEPPPGLLVSIVSDQDGFVWSGHPAVDGMVTVVRELSPGPHVLTLFAQDSTGLSRQVAASIQIAP